MKLLTLNTHSLIEENYDYKLKCFTDAVSTEKPDIIALQEVNQTADKNAVLPEKLKDYISCTDKAVIRLDNHVYNVVRQLSEKGTDYFWTWLPIKNGYKKFDEGIALMSLSPIIKTDIITVSSFDDYNNWKTRKILGICTTAYPHHMFYSVHFGWWNDDNNPFESQWNKTISHLSNDKTIWLMGDFNNPSEIKNQGYDLIIKSGWYDSIGSGENYITALSHIDGWKEKNSPDSGMRIDLILCNRPQNFLYSKPVFNNKNYEIVSDHFGVLSETAD